MFASLFSWFLFHLLSELTSKMNKLIQEDIKRAIGLVSPIANG